MLERMIGKTVEVDEHNRCFFFAGVNGRRSSRVLPGIGRPWTPEGTTSDRSAMVDNSRETRKP
jgi:hypothetical protein